MHYLLVIPQLLEQQLEEMRATYQLNTEVKQFTCATIIVAELDLHCLSLFAKSGSC